MRKLVILLAVTTAMASTGHAQTASHDVLVFVADLQGRFVAPAAIKTAASSKATGVLVGNRFTVHGSFTGLSSPLRDAVKTPNDPGVHLHRGAPGITTPYFHGLQVKLNADERSGIFYGAVTLNDEQKKALLATDAYVDIHTVKFGPGEVRDQWRPIDVAAAAKLLAALGDAAPVERAACHSALK
ncbi:MAG: CHRD domain-containing protein [Vicinamibacterales bacterium]